MPKNLLIPEAYQMITSNFTFAGLFFFFLPVALEKSLALDVLVDRAQICQLPTTLMDGFQAAFLK